MSRIGHDLLPELISFIEGLDEPRILLDLDYRILAANKAYRDAYAPSESVVGPPVPRGLAPLRATLRRGR